MHATLKYRIGKLLPAISLMSVLIIPLEAFEVGRDVQFELHTRHKHSGTFEILVADHRRFNVGEPTHFDFRKPTRIVVHGFNSQRKHLIQYTTAFLKKHDCNCIAVNWINGSNTLNYFAARSRVDQVGIALAELIDFLVNFHGAPLYDVLLVGHSLGAHICGVAGKRLKSMRIPVIVGLDPAYPLIKEASRLAITDAEYVQVIHTDAGHLGLPYPVGHADYYPNWGRVQPGCSGLFKDLCAHCRSYEFYIESLLPNTSFDGVPCASYEEMKLKHCTPSGPNARMGGDDSKLMVLARGVYYIQTGMEPPFSLYSMAAIVNAELKIIFFCSVIPVYIFLLK